MAEKGNDPFAFVSEALGVEVVWNDGTNRSMPGAPGYYLDTPGQYEWLGSDFTAALASARARVVAAGEPAPEEPRKPIDWAGWGARARSGLRNLVELLDVVLPEDDDGDDDAFDLPD